MKTRILLILGASIVLFATASMPQNILPSTTSNVQTESHQSATVPSDTDNAFQLPAEHKELFNLEQYKQLTAQLIPVILAYKKLPKNANNVEKLLALDHKLRLIVKQTDKSWKDYDFFEFKEIGIYNSNGLKYTGKLMFESEGDQSILSPMYEIAKDKNKPADLVQKNVGLLIAELNPIIKVYSELPKKVDSADKLYALDAEIRRIVTQAEKSLGQCGYFELEKIGVYCNGRLGYRGKLMVEADNLLSSKAASSGGESNVRKPVTKYVKFKDALEHIYAEYTTLPMKPEDAEKLVLMNMELNKLIPQIVEYYPSPLPTNLYEKKYSILGLGIGSYSDELEYSGKLILDAHKLNPFTRYREDTLFAYVFRDVDWSGGHPKVEELYAYLSEFPNSKYTLGIYRNLAEFYHGLFKYLRYRPKANNSYFEIRNECYKPYITSQPIETQISAAQKSGMDFYKKILIEQHGIQRHIYADILLSLELGENEERDAWCDVLL